MITWYILAEPVMNDRVVRVQIYRGSRPGDKIPMGDPQYFQHDEWESFRMLLVAGIHNSRIPTELQDRTRRTNEPDAIQPAGRASR